jgi:flagellar P-ring protein precursor FlgI
MASRASGGILKKFLCAIVLSFLVLPSLAEETVHTAMAGDIATIEGVRENPVLGYGLIVGLKGTGDRQQTIFTIQTLANVLQRMGVQIPAGAVGGQKRRCRLCYCDPASFFYTRHASRCNRFIRR